MDVVYKPELLTLSDADRINKASVDTNITQFYSATTRTATVTITTSPTTVTQGQPVQTSELWLQIQLPAI